MAANHRRARTDTLGGMTKPPTVRRSALVLGLACLLSLIAAPAMAQPERWSDPAPVNPMTAIIVS